MSLDVYLDDAKFDHCGREGERVYHANITHNLGGMAKAAGIYKELWRPEEIGVTVAAQLVEPLTRGLEWLKSNEVEARQHDAPNGWGLYEHFVPFVEKYRDACAQHPKALVHVWR